MDRPRPNERWWRRPPIWNGGVRATADIYIVLSVDVDTVELRNMGDEQIKRTVSLGEMTARGTKWQRV